MDAREILSSLTRRHPVGAGFAERFLPLLERAIGTAPEVRERILELVEGALEKESARLAEEERKKERAEEKVLSVVAGVLHGWAPPDWMLGRETGPNG